MEATVSIEPQEERVRLLEEWECLARAVEEARDRVKNAFLSDPSRREATLREALEQLQQTETLSHQAWLRFLQAVNLD